MPTALVCSLIVRSRAGHRDPGGGARRHGAQPPAGPVCRSSAATRRSSSTARPTASTSRPPGIGRVDPRASLSAQIGAPGRPRARLRHHRRPRHHRPARARRPRSRRRPALRHAVGLSARRRARRARWARPPLDARSDARRRRHRAQRAGARLPAWRSSLDEDAVPVRDEVRGACELLGLDPLHIANEGQFLAVVAPELADRALRGAARRCRAARMPRIIGEVANSRPRNGARRGRLRRHARRRHAGRRSAAADLLSVPRSSARPTSDSPTHVAERLLAAQPRLARVLRARGAAAGAGLPARWRIASCAAAGCSPSAAGAYATDAQHVAVEFVHPVIVGKRALPALDLSTAVRPSLAALRAARRHRDGLRRRRAAIPTSRQALAEAARARRADVRAAGRARRLRGRARRRADPFVHRS